MAGDEAGLPPLERFLRRVPNHGEAGKCWPWTGALTQGYGNLRVDGVAVGAHRFSWEHHNQRQIPDGLFIDHLCMNRACVNPDHLEPVTNRENRIRAAAIVRPKCIRGHKFDGVYPGNGIRYCKTCVGEQNRKARARRKARAAP